MNRILKYIKKSANQLDGSDLPDILGLFQPKTPKHMPEDKSPTELPENVSTHCSFCKEPLRQKAFRANSKFTPASAICGECVRKFEIMARFASDTFDIYFQKEPDYAPLFKQIMKHVLNEDGTAAMKKHATDIVIRLLKRGSAILANQKNFCPRTGVDLAPARIAFVGKRAAAFGNLLRLACQQAALVFAETTPEELSSGAAFQRIVELTNTEKLWAAPLGVIFCLGYAVPAACCNVIYACETSDDLPDDVEIIAVD